MHTLELWEVHLDFQLCTFQTQVHRTFECLLEKLSFTTKLSISWRTNKYLQIVCVFKTRNISSWCIFLSQPLITTAYTAHKLDPLSERSWVENWDRSDDEGMLSSECVLRHISTREWALSMQIWWSENPSTAALSLSHQRWARRLECGALSDTLKRQIPQKAGAAWDCGKHCHTTAGIIVNPHHWDMRQFVMEQLIEILT
jgi:hypothetical protein